MFTTAHLNNIRMVIIGIERNLSYISPVKYDGQYARIESSCNISRVELVPETVFHVIRHKANISRTNVVHKNICFLLGIFCGYVSN